MAKKQAKKHAKDVSGRTVQPNAEAIRKLARDAQARGPNAKSGEDFNVKRLAGGKDDPKAVAEFADYLDVAAATAKKLLNGDPVYPTTIQGVAQSLDCSVIDIVNFGGLELPTEPGWYTSLNLAFYIDNNRLTYGKPSWYVERIQLELDRTRPAVGRHSFTGTFLNQFDNAFSVKAFLVDRHLFTMVCTPLNKKWQLGFTASFTRRITLRGAAGETLDAVEGSWSGIDHVGRNAVYRIVLAQPGVIDCSKQAALKPLRILSKARLGYDPAELPDLLEMIEAKMRGGELMRSAQPEPAAGPKPRRRSKPREMS